MARRPRDTVEQYHETLLEMHERLGRLGIPFAPGMRRICERVLVLLDDGVRRLCDGPSREESPRTTGKAADA
ncbi:MAG: hypothetical protein AAF235_07260 [Planctomycetota bacterium]